MTPRSLVNSPERLRVDLVAGSAMRLPADELLLRLSEELHCVRLARWQEAEVLSRGDLLVRARRVEKAIAQARRPPRVWLQASTATIYAHRYDAPNDEATGLLGGTSQAHQPGTSASTSRSVGAYARGSSDAEDAQGDAPVGDDDEPGCRRDLRHASGARAAWTRRHRRGRPSVRLVDSLRRFRSRHALAHRP